MKRWTLVAAWLGLLWMVTPAFAAGLIIVENVPDWVEPPPRHFLPPHPPRPFPPPRPHRFAPLDVNYVKVRTHITDQVAVTAVDQ